jgi:hypothetical protein
VVASLEEQMTAPQLMQALLMQDEGTSVDSSIELFVEAAVLVH